MTERLRVKRLGPRLHSSPVVQSVVVSRSGLVGVVGLIVLVALVLLGPLCAPYSPTEFVGLPLEPPSLSHLFGTDELGRDASSRFLAGGRTLLAVTFAATGCAYILGIVVGMAAGYRRGGVDLAAMGIADLLIAFPPIVLLLILVGAAGTNALIATIAIAAIQLPRVVRIVRSVTLEVSTQEFVEAAVARGERDVSILRREILPNIWTPVMADFGIRLAGSALLYASLSYLGLGSAPPAADWGLMISENRSAVIVQPWVIIPPAVAIALLTISVNLAADAMARGVGRTVLGPDV